MAENKLLRIEAVWDSSTAEYIPGYGWLSMDPFLLGFFSHDAAISILDEFIGPLHYDWPAEPIASDGQAVRVTLFRSSRYQPVPDRLPILRLSLEQPVLTVAQSAELILEMAGLGEQLKYVYSSDGRLLGCYPEDYAEGRWGKLRNDRRTKRKVVNAKRVKENAYDLLSSQLMAPNHDRLNLQQQSTIADVLRRILRSRIRKEGQLASDTEQVFRLALSYNTVEYSVRARDGAPVGHFTELEAYDSWGEYEIDNKDRTITLHCKLSNTDRQRLLAEQLTRDTLSDSRRTLALVTALRSLGVDTDETIVLAFGDRQVEDRITHRTKPLLSYTPPRPDWQDLFRRVRDYYDSFEHDYTAGGVVLKQLRAQFGTLDGSKIASMLKRAMSTSESDTISFAGRSFDASQVLALALIGHQGATEALATILLHYTETNMAGRRSRTDEHRSASTPDTHGDAVPEWARPQRSAIEEWALKTRALGSHDGAGGVGSFIASQVGKGKLNVLVFESELYKEIRGAEIVGDRTVGIESFPFPMAVIPLRESASILGVAVFKQDELPSTVNAGQKHKGKFGSAYLLKNGGVTLTPEPSVLEVGDRLITYLDCESVQFDTAYVDGGTWTRKNAPSVATDAAAVKYARGSDFNTGTRIVVERERPKRIAGGAIGTRRSHFRRGFFRRQRVGTRDDWHYETRWIKPTFVHGTQAIVTERKVKRIVL